MPLADAFYEEDIPDSKHDIFRLEEPDVVMITREVALNQAVAIGKRAQKLLQDQTHSATIAVVTKRELGKYVTPRSFDLAARDRLRFGKNETKGQIYAATTK